MMVSYLRNMRVVSTAALLLIGALIYGCVFLSAAYANEGGDSIGVGLRTQAATIDDVRNEILTLSTNPISYKASDREKVEAIDADYKSLSAEDQAVLDAEQLSSATLQSKGRVLEAAQWAIWSYNELDNSTTLSNGTYDATTNPALSSSYSKGKSTSARNRPWSVKSVTVRGGKAMATIAVESSTYSGIWMGGVTYPRTNDSGNCEFANVPIDLNSTFYFAGISTSMPEPIAFSLTTVISEPDGKDGAGDNAKDGDKIVQASNSIILKTKDVKASFKAKKLKKKAASVNLPQAKATHGAVKWSVVAKDKKKVLTLKGSKVQVKKGAKKGKYTLKLKASVAATANYCAASADVKVTVTVK